MSKKMLIDATHAEETRVVVVDGSKVEEFDFESENRRQLSGNIYLAKVTRVEPSLQAAFVDYGGNRHGFLAFSEIHPDYYQIPVADREALMAEEYAEAEKQAEEDADESEKPKHRRRTRSRSKAAQTEQADAVETKDVTPEGDDAAPVADAADAIPGMDVVDLTQGEAELAEPIDAPGAAGDGQAKPGDATAEDVKAEPEVTSDDTAAKDDWNDDEQSEGKDDSIESVADDDTVEEIRPQRRPKPRRYKIQEVIKVRQILLVQVVKEERGNKGAALTTYLSLAGRYCVLMPNTARGGGISRKITNAADRKKLKQIATEINVPRGAGLIIRTAGAKRTKAEIRRDYEYLQRLWEQIRELTLKSVAPAKIYEEGDLIKRSIRDLYNREIDEVFVEGEQGYRTAKDFMKMIMPSHAKNVKQYGEQMPLFARYQVESYLAGMFNPTVKLKSGGYIVIGVTEALVAIDVNSGKSTKEGSIEDTALKTNLEAAEEIARQLRLRDLAGLIVVDFIDMEERKNNAAVEKKFKDKLRTDRARIQVGKISGFGLLEMSRQRLRPGMIEATTQPCSHCHGTGLIRSDDSLALSILRQLEEEGVRRRSREILVKAPLGIANYLMNYKREHVAQIEARYGMAVRIEADPSLVSPDFTIDRFKTATRAVEAVAEPVVSVDMAALPEAPEEPEEPSETSNTDNGEDQGKSKKRRRRRRRRRGGSDNGNESSDASTDQATSEPDADTSKPDAEEKVEGKPVKTDAPVDNTDAPVAEGEPDAPKKRRRTRKPRKKAEDAAVAVEANKQSDEVAAKPVVAENHDPRPVEAPETERPAEEPATAKDDAETVSAKPLTEEQPTQDETSAQSEESSRSGGILEAMRIVTTAHSGDDEPKATDESETEEPKESARQKRRGWWSFGS
ncbi:Rne/Rng family ribonuclease [Qingshengfaniella alkalisoli]|uniref:Ribonuclease E n=1 Tax=Qingshengfaniella alkalisoli TaxID=2599296 RepID=A0A5B8I6L9_9RHOB|nr:ribonuclease E/G [Qingshengfaniella alkalisoli]QDY69185.1 Rne/Rng family ribonuclease [Qingshengfaniella alkalisoli]